MNELLAIFTIFLFLNSAAAQTSPKETSAWRVHKGKQKAIYKGNTLVVKRCKEFAVTGLAENREWQKADWNTLTKLDSGGTSYLTRFKILYSAKGIYMLFSGEDDKITTKNYENFEAIFNGDVFEVFFQPEFKSKVYFEYEINQLSKELILTLTKSEKQINSWSPVNYALEDDHAIKRKVSVFGGKAELNSPITSWNAELFFPYSVLGLLPGIPPKAGATWKANFCRLDYDSNKMIKYSWSPTIRTSFHEIENFGSIKFE